MNDKIVMYTDGGSRGNPGPAAIGIYVETLNKKYCECIGTKTNNDAEYEALVFGLKKIRQLIGKSKIKNIEVECYLDSELAVKQLNHEYKIKEKRIQEYFIEIWNTTIEFGKASFIHIPREKNKIADSLVNQALDEKINQKILL